MTKPVCDHCGDEFRAPPSQNRQYCSRACSNKARSKSVTLVCEECGDHFSVPPSKAERATYCSRECKHQGQSKALVEIECRTCGDTFQTFPSHADRGASYCSQECFQESRRTYTDQDLICDECGADLPDPRNKHGLCKSCERKRFWTEWRGYKKICQECGKELPSEANPDQLYCHRECYAESRKGSETFYDASKPKVHKECEVCGEEMVLQQWRSEQRFCSYRCSNIGEPRMTGDTYECDDGHEVRSMSERAIDNWLHEHGIPHEYEPPVANRFLADWRVGDVYIEFWGFPRDEEYRDRMAMKKDAYRAEDLELLELFPEDLDSLDERLSELLSMDASS